MITRLHDEIWRMFRAGFDTAFIARKLGMPEATVYRMLSEIRERKHIERLERERGKP